MGHPSTIQQIEASPSKDRMNADDMEDAFLMILTAAFYRIRSFFDWLAACGLLLMVHSDASGQSANGNDLVLTNAAEIRALSVGEASRHLPVRLRGVVVLAEGGDYVVLADQTAGIYLQETNGMLSGFQVGDELSVAGLADPGSFAPIVLVSSAQKIGTGKIPAPKAVAFPELQTGRFDAQWVEISGVVRRSEPSEEDTNAWSLWVADGGRELPVRLSVTHGRSVAVDSEARLRGVCFYQFNKARQAVSPILQMPSDEPATVTCPAPAQPFQTPERTISSLLQFSPQDLFSHRVRVGGVVTYAVIGEGFWIRGDGKGIRVQSKQNQLLAVGDRVDVLGFNPYPFTDRKSTRLNSSHMSI